VEDVADNGHFHPLEQLEARPLGIQMATEGKQIQQPLSGVFVQAVSRIQHPRMGSAPVDLGGQLLRHPGLGVADDEHVGAHGQEGANCIQNGFPLGQGRSAGGKVEHIG
jgi:hypothetical protein